MTSSSDWWANKLASQQPAAPPPAPLVPVAPQALRLPVVQAPPEPAPLPQAAPLAEFDGRQGYLDVARAHDGEKISRMWKGGEAMRKEGGLHCPGCGSIHYFSRSDISTTNSQNGTIVTANPRCFECGYTTGHKQGEAASWG